MTDFTCVIGVIFVIDVIGVIGVIDVIYVIELPMCLTWLTSLVPLTQPTDQGYNPATKIFTLAT